MKKAIYALFLFYISLSYAQTSINEINLKSGKYKVGFKNYTVLDNSRTYNFSNRHNNSIQSRPINISIWYPATVSENTEKQTVLDYLQVLKKDEEWDKLPDYFVLDWFYYLWNTPENRKHLQEKTTSFKNAQALAGKYPVLIYSPSFEASSIENFVLMEYLASHGYIIVSTASKGTKSRKLNKGSVEDVLTQVADNEFLLNQIYKFKNTDTSKIGLIGYSFGGVANTLLAIKNKNIKTLVSLDGTERYRFSLLEQLPYFNVDDFKVPYIHFAQKDIPEKILKVKKIPAKLNYEFPLFDSIKNAEVYKLKMHDLTHSYFSSFSVLFAQRDTSQDKSDKKIMESYRLVSEQTLAFLNSKLLGENNNEFNVTSNKNLFSFESKKSKIKKFDDKSFIDIAKANNYEDLIKLYNEQKAIHPKFILKEGMLNTLGLALTFSDEPKYYGINIFKLAVYLYPNSGNLYDSLAEAYYFQNDFENAKINFEKSLKLSPNNSNAKNRLKELNTN